MTKGQFLSHAIKDKKKDHATNLFNKLKHPLQPNILCFFLDEKNFCQDQMLNTENHLEYAMCPQDKSIMMKTKHPVHIMMFGVNSSDSDFTPQSIFPHGLRLNIEAYIKCIKEVVVLPWLKRVVAGRTYVKQKDSASCHTRRRT